MKELDSKLDELEKDIKYLENVTEFIKSKEKIFNTYFGIRIREKIDKIVQDDYISDSALLHLQKKLYNISHKIDLCKSDLDVVTSNLSKNGYTIDKIFSLRGV